MTYPQVCKINLRVSRGKSGHQNPISGQCPPEQNLAHVDVFRHSSPVSARDILAPVLCSSPATEDRKRSEKEKEEKF